MDADRFDAVIRRFNDPSRRAFLGLTLGGGLASASLLGLSEADAKKKKKKKKKCKRGTKKCGKKCIAATACCSSADCDGRACVNGTCSCPDGEFPCGSNCVSGEACCEDDQCGAGQNCTDGFCVCLGGNDIACGELCCDGGDQVCKLDEGSDTSCQDGSCPASDWCNGSPRFLCANSLSEACACTTTVGAGSQNVCIDVRETDPTICVSCSSSAGCPSGQVCIAGNTPGNGACGCSGNFCVPLCD